MPLNRVNLLISGWTRASPWPRWWEPDSTITLVNYSVQEQAAKISAPPVRAPLVWLDAAQLTDLDRRHAGRHLAGFWLGGQ